MKQEQNSLQDWSKCSVFANLMLNMFKDLDSDGEVKLVIDQLRRWRSVQSSNKHSNKKCLTRKSCWVKMVSKLWKKLESLFLQKFESARLETFHGGHNCIELKVSPCLKKSFRSKYAQAHTHTHSLPFTSTHTHTHSHTHLHIHIHAFSLTEKQGKIFKRNAFKHTLFISKVMSQSYMRSLTDMLAHAHMHTHLHSLTNTSTHTRTRTHTHMHTLAHKHKHTPIHTHTRSLFHMRQYNLGP